MRSQHLYEQGLETAEQRLEAAGFHTMHMSDMPEHPGLVAGTNDGANVHVTINGDIQAAQDIVFAVVPSGTYVRSDSQTVRSYANHIALGPDTAYVNMEVVGPKDQKLDTRAKRRGVAHGDLDLPSERILWGAQHAILQFIDEKRLRDDQRVHLYGPSAGAIVAGVPRLNARNPSYGITTFASVGLQDPIGLHRRNGLRVFADAAMSGGKLFENIQDSDSPALLEAFGITSRFKPYAYAKFNVEILNSIAEYFFADWKTNVAAARLYGKESIGYAVTGLAGQTIDPMNVTIGWAKDSRVVSQKVRELYAEWPGIDTYETPGDHSDMDSMKRGPAGVVASTRLFLPKAA
jgi:hypothetical protein